MKFDRFIRICLVIIVVLLLVDIAKPSLQMHVAAASPPVQYKVVDLPARTRKAELILNELGKEGWQLVSMADYGYGFAILKK